MAGYIDPSSPYAQALAQAMMESNVSEEEEMLRRQQALADSLRTRPTSRMDTGSQIARAAQGIAGGLAEGRADKARTAVGDEYRRIARGLMGSRGPRDDLSAIGYDYGYG